MKRYTRIAVLIVLALVFGAAGLGKLIKPEMFQDQFAQLGLAHWFILATGAVELLGAVLIAFFGDTFRRLGAALLAVTMAVATMLHLVHDPLATALPAFALMLLAGLVALMPLRKAPKEELSGA